MVVGRSRRPAPGAVAARFFRPLLMARGRPAREWQHPPVPSRLGPHTAYAVGSSRRRPDAVAAWPLRMGRVGCQWPVAHSLRACRAEAAECARPRRLGTCLANAASTSRRPHGAEGQREQGEGSVRTTEPAPSEYPHATAFGKFEAPRQDPHVLTPGFGVDPPEGWVDWVWFGYRRGGCAKEMKRAELAQ